MITTPTCYMPCRWFYFRVTGAKDQELVINLVNAGQASYPDGWVGYQVCACAPSNAPCEVQTTVTFQARAAGKPSLLSGAWL